ncbi:acyltransferase [Leifsonia sp. NPDC058292]|uniref:acyltransferase n=1 Tax=Leifsonia sp. NPDC058292 TaxID=3346428 RepID=UPI0036D92C62
MSGSALLHVANLVSALLPQTRGFGVRRRLYRSAKISVAPGARINGGVVFQYPNVSVGEGTWVGRRSEFAASPRASITIGAQCDISQDVLFVTGSHETGTAEKRAGAGTNLPILVGDGCWIGARALILGGTTIGAGSIVAAGAVVRGEFPPNVLLAGVPAKIIKQLDEGGEVAGSG